LFSGILASGSRNAFIITIIGTILAILFAFKSLSNVKKFLLILLFIALILVVYSLGLLDNIFSRIENLETSVGENISEDPSFQSRIFMITFGLENFIYKPIFGYGINNAQFLLEEVFARTYLHNNYIELLVDVGIVGFCLYYIPQINLIKSLFKKRGDTLDICEILFVVLIVLMIADLSIVFYYNKLTYIILTIAMLANKSSSSKKQGKVLNE
jgi:O-antigen ligase